MINDFISSLLVRLQATRKEEGQTLVEYALIIALVSIVLVVALSGLATGIGGVYDEVVTQFS